MEQQHAEPSLPDPSGSVQSVQEKMVEEVESIIKQTESLAPSQPSFPATISPGDSVSTIMNVEMPDDLTGLLFNRDRGAAENPNATPQSGFPVPMSPFSPNDSVVRATSASPARKTRRFTCVRLLGRGGYAEVYLARDDEIRLFVSFILTHLGLTVTRT
jgi:hypothetical protein